MFAHKLRISREPCEDVNDRYTLPGPCEDVIFVSTHCKLNQRKSERRAGFVSLAINPRFVPHLGCNYSLRNINVCDVMARLGEVQCVWLRVATKQLPRIT